jgi:hypothetical protein
MKLEKELYKIIATKVQEMHSGDREDDRNIKVMSVRIPMELYTLIRTKAALKEVTQQEAVREALEHWLLEDDFRNKVEQ